MLTSNSGSRLLCRWLHDDSLNGRDDVSVSQAFVKSNNKTPISGAEPSILPHFIPTTTLVSSMMSSAMMISTRAAMLRPPSSAAPRRRPSAILTQGSARYPDQKNNNNSSAASTSSSTSKSARDVRVRASPSPWGRARHRPLTSSAYHQNPLCVRPFSALGPGDYCSPLHRVPSSSRNVGSRCSW